MFSHVMKSVIQSAKLTDRHYFGLLAQKNKGKRDKQTIKHTMAHRLIEIFEIDPRSTGLLNYYNCL